MIERTRERRLDELRAQLGSSNSAVVAWAAWRCGDEHISELTFDLRKAARRWGGQRSANAHTAAVLLDALIRVEAAVKPEDLETARQNEIALAPLLVLTPRARAFPEATLFAILDGDWTDETRAERQAAGNLLAAQRSPEIVAALLERAVVVVHVAVVDADAAPAPQPGCAIPTVGRATRAARADLPPWPRYVFWPDASKSVEGRIAGPVDVFWTRELGSGNDVQQVPVANTTSAGRAYAADLLAWLAEPHAKPEPFGDIQVMVDANELELGRERAHAVAAAARERWARVLAALERAGLLSPDSEHGREPRIGFETQDWRADKTIEIPAFGN